MRRRRGGVGLLIVRRSQRRRERRLLLLELMLMMVMRGLIVDVLKLLSGLSLMVRVVDLGRVGVALREGTEWFPKTEDR